MKMKKILVLLAAVALTATTLSAQVVPGMKYKDLKDRYNAKYYEKSSIDPYSTFWTGLASFAVPGLGQVIAGETGRGIAVFAGDAAFSLAGYLVANKALDYVQKDANGKPVKDEKGELIVTDEKNFKKYAGALIGVGLGNAIYWIWNICDARKVAKVKNMYYQDGLGKHAVGLDMYPSFDYAMTGEGARVVPGMTLAVQF